MTSENDNQPVPAEPAGEAEMSFMAKLVAVVLDPRRAFRAVAALPQPVPPILILMGVALIFAIPTRPIILEQIDSGEQMEQLIEQRNLSPEEAERALALQRGMAKIGVLVAAPLNELISCLIFAALLMFIGNALLGGAAKFMTILSAYAWAKMITILGVIAKTPLILLTGSLNVTLSPAIILPASATDSLLFAVLSVFDVFHIWEAILTCFAMAAVYKISMQRAVGFVGTLYVILAAVGIILRELFTVGGV